MLTYACPRKLLEPRCPPGTELDLFHGEAHVSLVAFDFLHTRVLGVGLPGLRDFPEINLRFYVNCGDRRGVVFIREYVPNRFVAWLARKLYNEPYRAASMSSQRVDAAGAFSVAHHLRVGDSHNDLRLIADRSAYLPVEESLEHHFKEHRWGFGTDRTGQRVDYEVRHPHWEVFPVRSLDLSWNWRDVYGPEWGFLEDSEPVSVMLAAGSGVEVFWRGNGAGPPS